MTPRVADIKRHVSAAYGLPLIEMESARRDRRIARPRQVAMYLACTLTPLSLPEIGQRFGRDHTTVVHARRRIETLMDQDKAFRSEVEGLKSNIPVAGFDTATPTDTLDDIARRACLAAVERAKTTATQTVSGSLGVLRRALGDLYGERPVGTGTKLEGGRVDLLVSARGSWSLLLTGDDGLAQLAASGHHWTAERPQSPAPQDTTVTPVHQEACPAPIPVSSPDDATGVTTTRTCTTCAVPFETRNTNERRCGTCRQRFGFAAATPPTGADS